MSNFLDSLRHLGDNAMTNTTSNAVSEGTQGNMESNASSSANSANENARTGMQTGAGMINAQMDTSKAVREMQQAQATDSMVTNISGKCSDIISKLGA